MAVGMLVVILLAVFVFLKPTVVPPAIPITPMSSLPALTQVGPTQTLAGVVAATATPEPTLTPSLTPSVTPSVTPTQKPTVIPTIPPGMVSISAGSFKMGGNQQDAEKPIHLVTLNGFWIDKYEVTNDGYAQCVAAKKCQVPTTRSSSTRADYYGNKQYSSYPVLYVSWSDAKAYCEWRGARLPTEAEWEKAARGGLDGKLYPWGDTLPSCTPGSANGAQSESCAVKDTAPVGSFASNGYGLFDMAGNVWEWVSDWYDAGYYSSSPANNPTGPANGELKGVRGNGWYFGLNALRVANRGSIDPASRTAYIGFRCAVSAP
jgi:formylglycine-generating enzyme required for sulfatase activity